MCLQFLLIQFIRLVEHLFERGKFALIQPFSALSACVCECGYSSCSTAYYTFPTARAIISKQYYRHNPMENYSLRFVFLMLLSSKAHEFLTLFSFHKRLPFAFVVLIGIGDDISFQFYYVTHLLRYALLSHMRMQKEK